jgi:X-Pro dipeptidyl-peptidase
MEPMKAALLMSHGFNDWNVMPEHSFRIYESAKAKGIPTQLFYHQSDHGGSPPMTMMNRWFTRYLHDVENDVENDPKVWIVRENDKRSEPTPYKDYPNPEASDVMLYLSSGNPANGNLNTKKPDTQGTEKLIDDYNFSGKDLAKAENSQNRLIYLTPILSEDVHISGVPKITIKLACNKPAANLSVWLVSLPWESGRKTKIHNNIITRGWADPQNHSSLTKGEPLTPGEFYELSFNLMPDDQIIPKGQQIGLMIFSTDREFTLWPEPGTELTIDLDATTITLPIVGGTESFNKAIKGN